mgnify:CR=1 FL=1
MKIDRDSVQRLMYTVKICRVIIIRDLCYPSHSSSSLRLHRNVSEFALTDLDLAPPNEEQSIATPLGLAPLSRLINTSSPLTCSDYASLLRHCGRHKSEPDGRYAHVHIVEFSREQLTFLGNLVIQMYGKCGDLIDAYATFEGLLKKNVFSWTSIISGLSHLRQGYVALQFYTQMQQKCIQPNYVTFVCVLKACSSIASSDMARVCHCQIVEVNHEVMMGFDAIGSSLIDMYIKCGLIMEARMVFDELPVRDIISWNVIAAGYADYGLEKQVFYCLEQMQVEEISPDFA